MAKVKFDLQQISGTLGGVVFVKTKKGTHTRAPRGTYKPLVLARPYQKQIQINKPVNGTAKMVHDVIDTHHSEFKKSDIWQDMQRLLRKTKSNDRWRLLRKLQGLEANPRYQLTTLISTPRLEVECSQGIMTLTLKHTKKPSFRLSLGADCYFDEIYVVFGDEHCIPVQETAVVTSQWQDLNGPLLHHETSFEIPVTAIYYAILLAVQGGKGGTILVDKPAKGLKVMAVGRLD